jgi:F-type H+-transporting ATPase subunit epsilon
VAEEISDRLKFELAAPAGQVFDGEVEMVVLPSVAGEMGILAHHAPLVTQLSIGVLRIHTLDGQQLNYAVSEGFAKVQFNKCIVLADTAEESGTIDVERVQRSLEKATRRLEMYQQGTVPEGEEIDPYREQLAIKRAQNRLKVVGMS